MNKGTRPKSGRRAASAPFVAAENRLRPWLLGGLTALTVATPLLPSESAATHGTGVVLIMLWSVLLLAWLAAGVWEGRLAVYAGPTMAALLVFGVWYSLSTAVMARYGQPRVSWNYLWLWLSLVTGAILTRQLIRTALERRALVAVMIAAAVGLSVHGYYQYFWSMPETRAAFQRDPEKVFAEAGVHAPPGSPQRRQFEDRLHSTEPMATFTLANSLAGFLSAWLVVTAGLAVASRGPAGPHAAIGVQEGPTRGGTGEGPISQSDRRRFLTAAAFSGLVIGGCWLLTKSRSAWIATFLGLVLLGPLALHQGRWQFRTWHLLAAASLGAMGVFFGFLVGGLDRLVFTEALKSFSYRIEYWQATWAMIAEHPWLGCGAGNFQQYYTTYKLPGASETVTDPHNFLLEIWASGGTPAMVAFLAVLGAFVWELSRSRPSSVADPARPPVPDAKLALGADHPGSHRPIYGGALVGLVLAYFPAGYLVGQAPDEAVLALGAPVAAATLLLWHGWVQQGVLPTAVIAAAVVTLLVNLLAAGGISFPGVAGTLWVLVALGLNRDPCATRPIVVSRGVAAGLTVLAALLLLLCQRTMYEPVLRGSALFDRSIEELGAGRVAEGERTLLTAIEVDPWAAQPWETLSAVRHRRWLQNGDEADLAGYREAAAQWLTLNPRSSQAWMQHAEQLLAAHLRTGDRQFLAEARQAAERAVELYPNDAMSHAQLALLCHLGGDVAAAVEQASRALQLDARTPHQERKLLRRRIFELPDQVVPWSDDSEQLMRNLRNAGNAGGDAEVP